MQQVFLFLLPYTGIEVLIQNRVFGVHPFDNIPLFIAHTDQLPATVTLIEEVQSVGVLWGRYCTDEVARVDHVLAVTSFADTLSSIVCQSIIGLSLPYLYILYNCSVNVQVSRALCSYVKPRLYCEPRYFNRILRVVECNIYSIICLLLQVQQIEISNSLLPLQCVCLFQ